MDVCAVINLLRWRKLHQICLFAWSSGSAGSSVFRPSRPQIVLSFLRASLQADFFLPLPLQGSLVYSSPSSSFGTITSFHLKSACSYQPRIFFSSSFTDFTFSHLSPEWPRNIHAYIARWANRIVRNPKEAATHAKESQKDPTDPYPYAEKFDCHELFSTEKQATAHARREHHKDRIPCPDATRNPPTKKFNIRLSLHRGMYLSGYVPFKIQRRGAQKGAISMPRSQVPGVVYNQALCRDACQEGTPNSIQGWCAA